MAGSYRHITDTDNNFVGIELIENLGDAYEALEECYQIICALSEGDKQKIFEAWRDTCPHPDQRAKCTYADLWSRE